MRSDELRSGDLGAVPKLKATQTNDTFAGSDAGFAFTPIAFAEPVLSYAIEPKSRGDEEKISTALQRLQEEDPTIRYERDAQTKQLLLSGQGQLHIEVTVAKLKRRFGVEVNLKLRESPTARHHGAHGGARPPQEADRRPRTVWRLQDPLEPLPRGADFDFANEVFGGSIPRQFIPAVEKGIHEAREKVPGRLSDGRFPRHPVRRPVPFGRLERNVVQDGRSTGLQGRDVQGEAHPARADHERPRCPPRATSRAT